jgi:hypothetical protein
MIVDLHHPFELMREIVPSMYCSFTRCSVCYTINIGDASLWVRFFFLLKITIYLIISLFRPKLVKIMLRGSKPCLLNHLAIKNCRLIITPLLQEEIIRLLVSRYIATFRTLFTFFTNIGSSKIGDVYLDNWWMFMTAISTFYHHDGGGWRHNSILTS